MKLVFATLLILIASLGWSQTVTSQEISGLVQDLSGSVVPNVTVTVKNAETVFPRTAQANDGGFYLVSNLPIGTYEITAEVKGFKKFITTGVVLNFLKPLTSAVIS